MALSGPGVNATETRRPLNRRSGDQEKFFLRASNGRQKRAGRAVIKWVTVDGGLPAGLDLRDRARMHDRLRAD